MKRIFLRFPNGAEIEYRNTDIAISQKGMHDIPSKGDVIKIYYPSGSKSYIILLVTFLCISNSIGDAENYAIQIDIDESH